MTKKYEYILEPAEIREFCRKAMTEQVKSRWWVWCLAAILFLADSFLFSERVWILVIMLAVLFLASGIRGYSLIHAQVAGQTWTLWLAEGRLKVARGNYSETPCESIQYICVTRRLLMLGYLQGPGRKAWYVMPLRVFENRREQDEFLNRLRGFGQGFQADFSGEKGNGTNISEQAGGMADPGAASDGAEGDAFRAALCLSYMMDAEKWVHFNKGAVSLIHAGTLGKKERISGMVFYGSLMAVVLTACISFLVGKVHWLTVASGLFITVIMLLRLFFRDPEKALRRQIKTPVVANRCCGPWLLSFSGRGIMEEQPGQMKNFYAWENLGFLVEAETAFYLFSKDKKRYIIVAKESFQDWEQVGVFHRLCQEKGIVGLPAKRMHYIPAWVLIVAFFLFYAAVLGGVAAFRVLQNSADGAGPEEMVYGSWPGDVSEAVYKRVPLQEQIAVLDSLGLHVPEETVESVQRSMVEYELYDLIEESPYTWILRDMGAPEWHVTGYSDEVFWFDFEGLDLSTDYVGILNGMLALAEGSCLDSVADIREDTEKVDWENGKGTVTVSLSWNGTRYLWDVKAYYDWIDSDVLGMFNTLLKQAGSREYFYVTGDNGQGAIVFFCTEEWAQDFTKATGLMLESVFTPADREQ